MRVECPKGVIEEVSGVVPAFHVFRNDHPECKDCIANFDGRCNTGTIIIHE
jgi:hypothetical protein